MTTETPGSGFDPVHNPDLVNFHGPLYDNAFTPHPARTLAIMDHARASHPDTSRYKAVVPMVKHCLTCDHWARLHPGHGRCRGIAFACPCTAFADPQPGRPDRIYTREQIDGLRPWRWRAVQDRVYLLKDGHYGVWDEWSDPSWLATPGQVSKPWLEPAPPTSPQEPPGQP